MSQNRVIGSGFSIPWDIPGEQQRFKETTWGWPVVMGRKTYESIGQALPGRKNIIISRNKNFSAYGCVVVQGIEEALEAGREAKKIFIAGGEQIYLQAMPLADTIILTTVDMVVTGDVKFPDIPAEFIKNDTEMGNNGLYWIDTFRRQ